MLTPHKKICWFAALSRLFVLFLSAIFNFIIPDHDAGVFQSPEDPSNQTNTSFDSIVKYLFGGLIRWDGQYYMHIALYGYTYENCLAFFPLYPMIVRILAECLHYVLEGFASHYSVYVLSLIIVNFVAFVISASVLYRLSVQVLRNEQLAYKAAILYCVNPATIFFVAPYSEALFACLTFYGMLKCGNGSSNKSSVGCGLLFGLSAVQRSNGILNLGFVFHEKLKHFLMFVMPDILTKARQLSNFFVAPLLLIPPVMCMISFFGEALLSVTPFIMFQGYGYYKFCIVGKHNLPDFIVSYAEDHNLRLPGMISVKSVVDYRSHWCNKSIPLAYSYIQDHYWDVGFLRYYHWKQIPNFLLALPIIWLILTHSYRFVKQNRNICYSLGLWDDPASTDDPKVVEKQREQMRHNKIKFAPGMFVYIVHVVFLTVFCCLFTHIQVTTRMIASASPVLYWFTAYIFFKPPEVIENKERKLLRDKNSIYFASRLSTISSNKRVNEEEVDSLENLQSRWKAFILTDKPPNREAKLIKYYCIVYIILGTLLFSNFFPWT